MTIKIHILVKKQNILLICQLLTEKVPILEDAIILIVAGNFEDKFAGSSQIRSSDTHLEIIIATVYISW